jgi:starch-binding outer membrane protein, SusD/RagB family
MRNPFVKTSLRGARLAALLAAIPLVGAVQGCTDLEENPTSTISPSNFYHTEQEVRAGLAGVYNQLRNATTQNPWYIGEVSSDEYVVPTRGQDWFDNGKWLEAKRQTWGPASALGADNINNAWRDSFTGVARANTVLNALQPNSVPNQAIYEAELRTLRAFYYYILLDNFGPVPIVTDVAITPRPQNTRAEVFAFVESELKAVRDALPPKWDAANYGRLTQGAVDALLASLYVNAEVFSGEVTTSGLSKGQARWQDAVDASDRILNSGVYSLESDFRSNFAPNNEFSRENIFVAVMIEQPNLGLDFINRSVHYNHYASPGGWNGFSTPAETYAKFDATDKRRQIFLIGPQVSLETGQPINDRAGNRLVLTEDIPDITQATEGQGIRPLKFPFDPAHNAQQMGNDFPYFRLAEIYLIKAEALNELGRTGEAIDLVNAVRARAFDPPKPIGAVSQSEFRTVILNERLFELYGEGKRRQDLIRMGLFTAPREFKETETEPFRILFPVPTRQIQTNPELVQNPGY